MTMFEIDTPHGRANAHLHPADAGRAALVLGHGAGGGVAARDLVTVTGVATLGGDQRGARRAALPRRRATFSRARASARRRLDRGRRQNLLAGELRGLPLLVGGRSSGARVACRTAGATGAAGVLCLAFPLQPPRRAGAEPAPSRLAELEAVTVPTLVVQGARDPFGIPPAGEQRTVVQVEADHGLKTDLQAVAAAVRAWLLQLDLASG